MRKAWAVAAVATAALTISGCQRHSKSDRYFLIAGNTKVPYWKTVASGFQQAAANYGVTATIDGPDGKDVVAEADAFQRAVAMKPAGILVGVLDAARMRPLIDSAVLGGIPVVTVDSDAQDSARLYFIGTNNYQAGQLGGQRLVKLLNGKGNVVFFTLAGQTNMAERLKGYMDAMAEHAGIKTIEVVDIHGSAGTAFDKTREFLGRTGNDRVDAFVSLDSVSGKDVADAMQRQQVTDRKVIAMDVGADVLELIQSGAIQATLAQKPYTMGYVGLKSLVHVHEDDLKDMQAARGAGEQSRFASYIDTGTAIVDKNNVDAYLQGSPK